MCGGTWSEADSRSHCWGSIPACAGEPLHASPSLREPEGVYPRVCGGTFGELVKCLFFFSWGLSPRVRGNPLDGLGVRFPRGLSPRVRGNLSRWTGFRLPDRGLSPRVRGNRSRIAESGRPEPRGLSPRVRGNHSMAAPALRSEGVYPRVCGGTSRSSPVESHQWGLSPRVRGKSDGVKRLPDGGLSPRVRGNLQLSRSIRSKGLPLRPRERSGLSPRVRGNQPRLDLTIDSRVYPRVCGGTLSHIGLSVVDKGLSPRVRGNLLQIKY